MDGKMVEQLYCKLLNGMINGDRNENGYENGDEGNHKRVLRYT